MADELFLKVNTPPVTKVTRNNHRRATSVRGTRVPPPSVPTIQELDDRGSSNPIERNDWKTGPPHLVPIGGA